MRHKCFPPARSFYEGHRFGTCVVELTPRDLVRAACLLAADRDEYIPHGEGTAKLSDRDGTLVLTIRFDPDEQT